jgi:lipoate-protein ligase A
MHLAMDAGLSGAFRFAHAPYNIDHLPMHLLELTLPTPEANIALDEALLEEAEAAGDEREVLRIWESPQPLVVIGRSSRIEEEVAVARCRELGVPVIRRSSGGAAIVAGPGCLMYAVVLSYARRPQLKNLDEAHRTVLESLAAALARLHAGVCWAGTSDLAIGEHKFSGNSLRCKRSHLVYHGTLLYDFPLALVGELLKTPPRQPEYRQGRAHGEFVANLPLSRAELRSAVLAAFPTDGPLTGWPRALTEQLAREKYALASWNARL